MDTDTDAVKRQNDANAIELNEELAGENPVVHNEAPDSDLLYGLEDIPPWYMTLAFALQQILLAISGAVSLAFLLPQLVCAAHNGQFRAQLLSTSVFMCGLSTFLQCTIGIRLPIMQGSSHSFVPPILAMMSLSQWRCQEWELQLKKLVLNEDTFTIPQTSLVMAPSLFSNTTGDLANYSALLRNSTSVKPREDPHLQRVQEINGCILVASIVHVILGATGLLGLLMRFIGPITIVPVMALIGFGLVDATASLCAPSWPIAALTIVLLIFFSMYLDRVMVPIPVCCGRNRGSSIKYPLFKVLPILLGTLVAWLISLIVTLCGGFPDSPEEPEYFARTDAMLGVIGDASWFRVPYPGQWKHPMSFGTAGIIGMISAIIASAVESVGDYHAAAVVCDLPAPPHHALNRGIAVEGLCSLISSVVGAGHATTSYSGNIACITVTRVGSRRVFQAGGLLLILFGMFAKFGAVLAAIPNPIIGGLLLVGLSMVVAVSLACLQFVDLTSNRNTFILGIALFTGVMVPRWMHGHPDALSTGYVTMDQVLQVFLNTPMFLGGVIGFILDNTVPATREERGLDAFRIGTKHPGGSTTSKKLESYNLPYTEFLKKYTWAPYVPFLPTYAPDGCRRKKPSRRDSELPDY